MYRLAIASKSPVRPVLMNRRIAAVTSRSPSLLSVCSVRTFSEARDKLRAVFRDYRKANYTQELPSRYAKEVTLAADADGDGFISVTEIEQLLKNIGAKDALTEEEIKQVIEEIGASQVGPKGVPAQVVIDYVKESVKGGK